MATLPALLNAEEPVLKDASPLPIPAGYELVWSEEFDYTGLPDPEKWGYEEGFVRNAEKQYYTRERQENVRVENGHLVIEGRKEPFKNAKRKEGGKGWQNVEMAEYTSGSITTRNKADWTYGRIDVRAKLPQGKGQWPAIWMLGSNINKVGWPKCGEIDIMEYVGKEPNHVFATMHWFNPLKDGGKHDSRGSKIVTEAPYEDFHVYSVEWTAEKATFYFDEKQVHTFDITENPKLGEGDANPFHKPHYLILNLALGGSWGGELDDSKLPQQFLVDYVRVYQKTK